MTAKVDQKSYRVSVATLIVTSIYMAITLGIFINDYFTLKQYKDISILTNRPIILPCLLDRISNSDQYPSIIEIPFANKGNSLALNISYLVYPYSSKLLEISKLSIIVKAACAPNDRWTLPININSIIDKNNSTKIEKEYLHIFICYTSTGLKNGYKPPYYIYMATYKLQLLKDSIYFIPIGGMEEISQKPIGDQVSLFFNPPDDYRFSETKD